MGKYRFDEQQWEGNSEEDDAKDVRTKIDPEEFARLQEELKRKIQKHVSESDASRDLTNPEFIDE